MPAFNASKYIVESVKSVLSQTFGDYELIVVDDCSTDNTVAVIEQFARDDSRIRVLRMERNFGRPAGPRNRAVREAKGEWIAFLDSDDIWHPHKLAAQMEVIRQTGALFCSTRMQDFRDGTTPALPATPAEGFERVSFLRQLIKLRTPTSSVVARRDLLLRHPFVEDESYKAREDLDCWLHCHEEIGSSVRLSARMLAYRIIPSQISGNKWIMVKRHYHALRRYRLRSGRRLGLAAGLFTFTHFALALALRPVNRGL